MFSVKFFRAHQLVACLLLALFSASSASATQWSYDLGNGVQFNQPGLWFKLVDSNVSQPDIHLNFDFNHASSTMSLVFDDVANSILISGVSFVSAVEVDTVNNVSTLLNSGVASINFLYQANVTTNDPDQAWDVNGNGVIEPNENLNVVLAAAMSNLNTGTVNLPFATRGTTQLNLLDKGDMGNPNRSFRLIEWTPGLYRGDGWFQNIFVPNNGDSYAITGDWHFSATGPTNVPEPGTLALMTCALLIGGVIRRRRS